MTGKTKHKDDLDQMRQDMDRLGKAFGIYGSGERKSVRLKKSLDGFLATNPNQDVAKMREKFLKVNRE